ncbi:MAG: aminotransferase class IV, partial [Ginsengibacter sp.]
MTEHFFLYNNKFYAENTPVISSENRSLRYGDGLFETMKVTKGRIVNKQYHFERLFSGLDLLQFEFPKSFSAIFLEKKITELITKNNHFNNTRIRLMIFRGNGGIFDPENNNPNYIIESWNLSDEMELNQNGL